MSSSTLMEIQENYVKCYLSRYFFSFKKMRECMLKISFFFRSRMNWFDSIDLSIFLKQWKGFFISIWGKLFLIKYSTNSCSFIREVFTGRKWEIYLKTLISPEQSGLSLLTISQFSQIFQNNLLPDTPIHATYWKYVLSYLKNMQYFPFMFSLG